jgi:creatinine amidohydrolase
MTDIIEYSSLTNFEIEEINKNKYLIIPIGSVEAHGHHLSMNNDNLIAQFLAKKVCIKTSSILCSQLQFGNTSKLSDFPGTINIRPEILKEYLFDILKSYINAGFSNIIIINAHKGNNQYIRETLERFKNKNIKFAFYKDLIEDKLDDSYKGNHSNRLETELALLSKKDSVKMEFAQDNIMENSELIKNKFDRSLMPNCIDGNPSKSNINDANIIAKKIISKLVKMIS